jgi:5-methylthioadenosine/S-adenosylhomocysteine deaminase
MTSPIAADSPTPALTPPPPPLPAEVDLLIVARWVVPVAPAGTVLENYAVAIDNGRIRALLPATQAAGIAARQTVRLDEHVLLPGLVNAHNQTPLALLRGLTAELPPHSSAEEVLEPLERQWLGPAFAHDGSQLAIAEMLLSGTTCFSDTYFFPEIIARAAQDAGLRAQLHFPVSDRPNAWSTGSDESIHKGLQLFDEFKHSALIGIGFGPHAPHLLDDAPLARVAMLAAELDASIQLPVHAGRGEFEGVGAERPLARLQRLGLLGPRTLCVQAIALDAADIALLAHNNSHVVYCPEADTQRLGSPAPLPQLLAAGINVALGTDSAFAGNGLDLFGAIRGAALLARAGGGTLPAHVALHLATLGGARALGLDEHIGSLEVGKAADIIAVDMSGLDTQPLYQPLPQLLYTNSGSRVSHSWVAGRALLENRRLTTLDAGELRARSASWQQKIGVRP